MPTSKFSKIKLFATKYIYLGKCYHGASCL